MYAVIRIENTNMDLDDGLAVDLKESQENADVDDDLKSLNWLLSGGNAFDSKPKMNISPTNRLDVGTANRAEKGKHVQKTSLDTTKYQLQKIMRHPDQLTKPPHSFSLLIFMAIEDSKQKMLPVEEIYSWILDRYPYYQTAPSGWKNSVRDTLSQDKYFCKVQKEFSGDVPLPSIGKGSLWTYHSDMCHQFLEVMRSLAYHFPYHPYDTPEVPFAPLDLSCTSNLPDKITVRKLVHPSNHIIQDEDIDRKPRRGRPSKKSGSLPDAGISPYLNKHFSSKSHESLHSGRDEIGAAAMDLMFFKLGRKNNQHVKDSTHEEESGAKNVNLGKTYAARDSPDSLANSDESMDDHGELKQNKRRLAAAPAIFRFPHQDHCYAVAEAIAGRLELPPRSNQIIEDEDIDRKPRRGRPPKKSKQSGSLADSGLSPYLNKHLSSKSHESFHLGCDEIRAADKLTDAGSVDSVNSSSGVHDEIADALLKLADAKTSPIAPLRSISRTPSVEKKVPKLRRSTRKVQPKELAVST